MASGGKSQEKLNKDCWFVAMKLVALVQSTGKCQMQSLYAGDALPLADFQLDRPPDNVVRLHSTALVAHCCARHTLSHTLLYLLTLQLPEESACDFQRSFVVSVSTPVVVGSGYTRYTQYVISTKVRLAFIALVLDQRLRL